MLKHNDAPAYAVYLGLGIYLGGVVHADAPEPDLLTIDGAPDGAALALTFDAGAASYCRAAAVRMCHVARRAGLGAWVVRRVAVAI